MKLDYGSKNVTKTERGDEDAAVLMPEALK